MVGMVRNLTLAVNEPFGVQKVATSLLRRLGLKCCVLFLLATTFAFGQATVPVPESEPEAKSHLAEDEDDRDQIPEPASAKTVPLSAPVITIRGFCQSRPSSAVSARECNTRISRAEFEKFATAIRPKPPMSLKLQLAQAYPKLLVMSTEAKQEGLDQQEDFELRMEYAKMQLLTQALLREIQEKASHIPESKIAAYYDKNRQSFQEFTLQRLVVPLREQKASADSTEKMRALAADLRARAAAGEDFVKLQSEAFEAAGIHVAAPNVTMSNVRSSSLPRAHASVFDLEEGQVSGLITDAGGHYVYRLEAKHHLSLKQVRGEIKAVIKDNRIKDALAEIQNSYSVEMNPEYFGAPPASAR
jgi:hypothetical protein